MNKVVVIMAKVPAPGTVKTRLQPSLSAEQCADLAACFLRDAVNKINSLENKLIIAYSPIEKHDVLLEILPEKQLLTEQKGANLGDKMFNAFRFAFDQNAAAVVVIGTDSPTLPPKFIVQAFDALSAADAVLGAATDGGFYLIGLRKLKKEIFENVEWSSPHAFEQTRRNIKNAGFSLSLLPVWYDVDTPEDLKKLESDLLANPTAASETFRFLQNHPEISR